MNDETGPWSASAPSVRRNLRRAVEDDADAAAVTVAGVEGSAYRRPGAKRVVATGADGEAAAVGETASGATAAGPTPSSDGPVADLAERALADGPLRETLDLNAANGALAFGLGCNGVVDLLVEPADRSFRPALDAVAGGERVALLTVVGGDHPDAPVGARAVVREEGEKGEVPDADAATPRPALPDDLLAAVSERAAEFAGVGRSDTVAVETDRGTAEVFVDGLEPAPELLVFGGDGDARPVARLGRDAGFRVTVAVPRETEGDSRAVREAEGDLAERFPAAREVVAVRPSELAEAVSRPADTYAVLMSHDFAADRRALDALLATEVSYLGLLGPRKRFESMRDALAADGVELSADDRDRIASPVGLDLGGGDPAQVALSIVGEALAAANGREGGRLTDAEEPIHPRNGGQR